MAKPKAKEYGKTYAEKLLAKLPEDVRNAVKASFESDDVAEFLGADVLRQEDYSRLVQERDAEVAKVVAQKQMLDNWWAEKGPLMIQAEALATKNAELEALIAAGNGGGNTPPFDTSKFIAKSDLDAKEREFGTRLAQVQNESYQLAALMPTLVMKHHNDFGEVLDTQELFNHVRKVGIPLDKGGYDSFVADKRAEKSNKEWEAKLKAATEESYNKGRMSASTPYPVGADNDGPLAAIFNPSTTKEQYGSAAAMEYFNQQRSSK